ncbi:M48 family metalloprotease [Gallaecimonas sp. GXIMD4217]|uniref:M48 family metalloprotease n=1 Tax=Gallaecimonas sp. GXIMD4217 TaxID=3131927 RepID=UPI00311B0FFE
MKVKGICAALVLALGAAQVQGSNNLPEIGTASLNVLTLEKEQLLGELYTKQLRNQAPMVRDPLVTEYVQALGYKLVAHAENVRSPFDFMVIRAHELNAFAYFGGHVAVFTSIIEEADSEDELASVLAHEIAHITQRHLARAMEQSQKNLPLTIAAVAASILVGMANPEAGMAGLNATLAASQQLGINYTRSNEQEADRVGFQTLNEAGYDPRAAASFFGKMAAKYRFVRKPPEFLLTHPLPESRVTDARNRAELYPRRPANPSLDFHLVKMLLKANYGRDPKATRAGLDKARRHHEAVFPEALDYGLALLDLQEEQGERALATAERLLKKDRHNLFYLVLKADALMELDRAEEAAALLEHQATLRPEHAVVSLNLANAWLKAKQPQKAAAVLEPHLFRRPDDALALELMIEAQAKADNEAAREYWQAERMAYLGAFRRAINHMHNAYRLYEEQPLEQRRIEGRIAQLKNDQARLEALK